MNHFGQLWIVSLEYRRFEGPPCVSVVRRYFQMTLLREGSLTCCLTRGLADMSAPTGCWEKVCPLNRNVSGELKKEIFFGTRKAFFCWHVRIALLIRGPSGRLFFLYLFIYFILCLFYFIFYVIGFLFLIRSPHTNIKNINEILFEKKK